MRERVDSQDGEQDGGHKGARDVELVLASGGADRRCASSVKSIAASSSRSAVVHGPKARARRQSPKARARRRSPKARARRRGPEGEGPKARVPGPNRGCITTESFSSRSWPEGEARRRGPEGEGQKARARRRRPEGEGPRADTVGVSPLPAAAGARPLPAAAGARRGSHVRESTSWAADGVVAFRAADFCRVADPLAGRPLGWCAQWSSRRWRDRQRRAGIVWRMSRLAGSAEGGSRRGAAGSRREPRLSGGAGSTANSECPATGGRVL